MATVPPHRADIHAAPALLSWGRMSTEVERSALVDELAALGIPSTMTRSCLALSSHDVALARKVLTMIHTHFR